MNDKLVEKDKLHGFSVSKIREIKELEGKLVEMVHDETGAQLVWVDNGEENKLFSVGFKTLPEDSTGVFHILEHSVLCGSDKFPVKEPFVELLKTSMNTFLNAMTYPDKTLYPVSSRIEQDYLNLAEVYLDAVFRPAILSNPNIFYQEGWHIDTDGDEPSYKGVVFNEMKGAMSEVDQVAERGMMKLLFPNNCYGYNSGGDPEAIPDLTYESYIDTYKRYYHPSNAYFYLDGDVPLEKTLEMINSYLEGSDRLTDVPKIEKQVPMVDSGELPFAAADEDAKGVLVFGRIIADWHDRDKLFATSVLLEQIADSNESPLKRAVLSAGLAEDMEIFVSDGIDQPYLIIIFRGVKAGDGTADEIKATLKSVIDGIKSEGIPKENIEASVNQLDFRFRQYPEPQGLYRANAVFASWLYGGDPAFYLKTDEIIEALGEMAKSSFYEDLAEEIIGDVDSFSVLRLTPDAGFESKQAEDEATRVKAMLDAMSKSDLKNLKKLNSDLVSWQQTPDSEEALAKIPMLELSDISPTPELIASKEEGSAGITVLHHPLPTNGIVYINAYFPLTNLFLSELPAAALMTELYKELPTEKYDVLSLMNERRRHVGSITFSLDILALDNDREHCTPCIRARASVLEDKLSYAEDLIVEILTNTKFGEKDLLRELVSQIDEDYKRDAISAGHRLALCESRSHWSAKDAAAEAVNGYSFMQYMHEMAAGGDEALDAFAEFAAEVTAKCINRNNVIISQTSSEFKDLSGLVSLLPDGESLPESAHYESKLPARMGIQIPAQVSFAVSSYDMRNDGYRMNGSMAVASNIISLSMLWNEIRVQGGAYGASMSAGRTGNLICYTYRDPSPARSLGIYQNIPAFLSELASVDAADLSGFIISTVASTEPLLSPAAKGKAADDFYLSGFSDKDRIRFRTEMLETTAAELSEQSAALEEMAKSSYICVVGPKAALEECEDLHIVEL